MILTEKGFKGRNTIQSAVVGNNFEALKYLDKFVNISELWSHLDEAKSSTLSLAAEFSDFKIFEYVAEKSSILDFTRTDDNGKNVLDCAMLSLDLEKIKYIAK